MRRLMIIVLLIFSCGLCLARPGFSWGRPQDKKEAFEEGENAFKDYLTSLAPLQAQLWQWRHIMQAIVAPVVKDIQLNLQERKFDQEKVAALTQMVKRIALQLNKLEDKAADDFESMIINLDYLIQHQLREQPQILVQSLPISKHFSGALRKSIKSFLTVIDPIADTLQNAIDEVIEGKVGGAVDGVKIFGRTLIADLKVEKHKLDAAVQTYEIASIRADSAFNGVRRLVQRNKIYV